MTQQPQDRPYDSAPFLSPLTLPIVQSDAGPLLLNLQRRIARIVPLPESAAEVTSAAARFASPASRTRGGSAPIDDFVATLPAHLIVLFVLQEMANQVVSGNGVEHAWAKWETHSSAATQEKSGPFFLPAPMPGETWPLTQLNVIYRGLVQDGCGNTPVFPVQFHSEAGEMENALPETFVTIGEFSAVDDTTLQPNGFWNFSYTIRATGTGGGVSDFTFKGIVSVTCTNIETL